MAKAISKLSRIAKLRRTGKELVMGAKTYMPKNTEERRGKGQIDKWRYKTRKKQGELKAMYKTARTKAIEKALSGSGLSKEEIARFRKKD